MIKRVGKIYLSSNRFYLFTFTIKFHPASINEKPVDLPSDASVLVKTCTEDEVKERQDEESGRSVSSEEINKRRWRKTVHFVISLIHGSYVVFSRYGSHIGLARRQQMIMAPSRYLLLRPLLLTSCYYRHIYFIVINSGLIGRSWG